MAGLFDIWKGTGEQPMFSFTILTTDSSEKLQWCASRTVFYTMSGACYSVKGILSVLPGESCDIICRLHDRMPVILPDEAAVDLWLSGGSEEAVQ